MKLIKRKDYLNILINVKNTPDIKITSFIYRMVKKTRTGFSYCIY